MNLFFKKFILIIFLMLILFQFSGCGETVQGIGKDVTRVGKGIKTIFIRDGK